MKNVPKKPVKKTMSKKKKYTITAVVIFLVLALGLTLWLCLKPEPVILSTQDGSFQLTNRDFAYYYWDDVKTLMASEDHDLGIDFTKPLSEQLYDENRSWEEYFKTSILDTIEETMAFALEAERVGFELPAESEENIDDIIVNFQDAAMGLGYESVDDYLCYCFHEDADLESFEKHLYYRELANAYAGEMYQQNEPAEDEVLQYYTEHFEEYGEEGMEQARQDLHRDKYNNAYRELTLTFPFNVNAENISLTAPDGLYE